jgi:hypothetical protein
LRATSCSTSASGVPMVRMVSRPSAADTSNIDPGGGGASRVMAVSNSSGRTGPGVYTL